MANRYPLIVNPSTNQIQEIPFADTLDLSGNNVNEITVIGVSTLGDVKISSGIITATTGIVTYYGDGQYLQNLPDSGISAISTNTQNINQLIPYSVSTGTTVSLGSTSNFVFNPSTTMLGIGTTNPTSNLYVVGNGNFTGVVTATTFFGDGSKLSGVSGGVSISTNTQNINQLIPYSVSTGTTTGFGVTSNFVFNPSTTRLGIGTDQPIHRVQIGSRADLVQVLVATGATIGVTTTIITGISTASITRGLEIFAIDSIIAAGTTVTDIGSTSITIGTASLNGTQQNNVTLLFGARNDGNLVVVTGIGSVGIGTTNPKSKLQVNGDINLDDGAQFTTTLQVITPTSDRTISLPDATGTVGLVAGSSSQLIFNSSGAYAGAAGLTYSNSTQALTVTGLTTTTNTPVLNISQTWNAVAVAFTGIQLNITNTASAVGSALMDFQLGGTRQLAIGREGHFIGNNGGTAGLLEQRSSTQAQIYRIYNTYTDASNYERGKLEWSSSIFRIGVEKAGTGSARALELQTDGVTRVAVAAASTSIGIGIANPGATLHVVPASTSIAGLFSGTTSSDMVRITQLGTGNALVVEDETNPDTTPFVVNTSGSIGIRTNNPIQPLQINSGSSVMVVDTIGKIGIGTTNPRVALDVIGSVNISGVTTIGLGSTSSPSSNSTFSFELTDNNTLTVRVRGSDGITRTGTIALT